MGSNFAFMDICPKRNPTWIASYSSSKSNPPSFDKVRSSSRHPTETRALLRHVLSSCIQILAFVLQQILQVLSSTSKPKLSLNGGILRLLIYTRSPRYLLLVNDPMEDAAPLERGVPFNTFFWLERWGSDGALSICALRAFLNTILRNRALSGCFLIRLRLGLAPEGDICANHSSWDILLIGSRGA